MLDYLIDILGKRTNIRILPRWRTLHRDLDTRQLVYMQQFLELHIPNTPNVVLLKGLLSHAGDIIHEVRHIDNDLRRVMYLMSPRVRQSIEHRIDAFRTQQRWRDTFYKGRSKDVVECVIPVTISDPLMQLPTTPSEEWKWEQLQPMRLIYHDSPELSVDLLDDPRVTFKRYDPSLAVIAIDMVVLIMKFVKYLQRNNLGRPGQLEIHDFLREEVFYHQYRDLRDIWILNLLEQLLECEDSVDVDKLSKEYKSNRFSFADYTPYFIDIWRLIEGVKDGSVEPTHFLNTGLFHDGSSLMERLITLHQTTTTRDLRQYAHFDMATYIVHMRLVLTILSYSRLKNMKRTIGYELYRRLRILQRNRLHLQFREPTIKNWFENEVRSLGLIISSLHE